MTCERLVLGNSVWIQGESAADQAERKDPSQQPFSGRLLSKLQHLPEQPDPQVTGHCGCKLIEAVEDWGG